MKLPRRSNNFYYEFVPGAAVEMPKTLCFNHVDYEYNATTVDTATLPGIAATATAVTATTTAIC